MRAMDRAQAHALHFADSVREELAAAGEKTGSSAIIVATFDTELFGHWWYEGVDWLALVLRDLAGLTSTAAAVLSSTPPSAGIALREGSSPMAGDVRARAARQALRELMLAQSSDWPFLVTTGQAAEYASERFRTHAVRFDRALAIARHGTAADEIELRTLERVDDLFPEASLAGAL